MLDGVENVSGETLAVLSRLLLDREMDLPDGTRLVSHEAYEVIQQRRAGSGGHIAPSTRVQPIGAGFRVIGIAAVSGAQAAGWKQAVSYFDSGQGGGQLTRASSTGALAGSSSSSRCPSYLHPEVLGMWDTHLYPDLGQADVVSILVAHMARVPVPLAECVSSVNDMQRAALHQR